MVSICTIAEVLHRVARRLGTVAERRRLVEALGVQPDVSGGGLGERDGLVGRFGHGKSFQVARVSAGAMQVAAEWYVGVWLGIAGWPQYPFVLGCAGQPRTNVAGERAP